MTSLTFITPLKILTAFKAKSVLHKNNAARSIGFTLGACLLSAMTGCTTLKPALMEGKLSAFKAPTDSLTGAQIQEATVPLVETSWWELFGDKDLTALQEHALTESFSLRAALTRLAQAKGLDSVALLQVIPKSSIGMTGTVSKSKGSSQSLYASSPSDINYKQNTVQRNANVSWELPLFGQIPAILAQAQANEEQAHWTYEGAKLSLATEIANTYLDTLGVVQKIEQLKKEVALLQDLQTNQELLIVKKVGAAIDSWKISGQILDAQTQLTLAQAQYDQLKHKMTALVGEVDDAYVEGFRLYSSNKNVAPLGQDHAAVNITLPVIARIEASSLRKRPDLGVAESKVLAAGAQAGLAVANLYPQFTLQGSLTAINGALDSQGFNKGNSNSLVTSIGLHIPILDWFALRAQATAKQLELEATVFDYRNTVVNAWDEAKTAFTDYKNAEQQVRYQTERVDLAQKDLKLQEMLMAKKMGSRENLISAQLAEERAKGELIKKRIESKQAWIKVLKGAWR